MKKIAALFPGQGSQYVGMGKTLCENFKIAEDTFNEANDVLGFDLKKLCFEGNMDELTKTENTQPAILTASVASFRVYMKEIGIDPAYLAGHSLGEITALTCAEAIKFPDALEIVRQRGKFMQDAVAVGVGGMAAISGVDKELIEKECLNMSSEESLVVISNYNSPEQIVISGNLQAVTAAGEKLKEIGAKVIPLKVSAPFHSPLMQPAADKLKEELKLYSYGEMKWPVISNVTARPYGGPGEIVDTLTKQIVKPVRWQESVEYLQSQGLVNAVELGPKKVLTNLMKKNAPEIVVYSLDNSEDVGKIAQELDVTKSSGFKHTVVTKSIAIAVCTRNRNWDNDEYQKGVVEPYRKIQKMQEELEQQGKEPTIEQMKEALEMLRSVFVTKKVPVEEQIERFNELFEVTGTRSLFPDFEMPV